MVASEFGFLGVRLEVLFDLSILVKNESGSLPLERSEARSGALQ